LKLGIAKAWITHWLNAVDEHSIHSPFIFDFYQKVIKASRKGVPDQKIEELRNGLLTNPFRIEGHDFGAGSHRKKKYRTLADIARIGVAPPRLSLFYLHILQYTESRYVIELGTSLGLNTLYLASQESVKVFTFEGSKPLANVALTHFELFDKSNIKLIEGNIDHTLPAFLQQTSKINFVLMDANHRYEPTVRYFRLLTRRLTEKSVVVIDDIHWSEEMEKAWNELRHNELVYGSIDLYRCGILFFDPALNKQHFVIAL